MKIAIHAREGSFSDDWKVACDRLGIESVFVDVYASDAVKEIKQCDAFMWHWTFSSSADILFARQIIMSLEQAGVFVFPNINTCWHFDDKVGQKYLFEALDIPTAKSWAFYDKAKAITWAKTTTYPKIFKLRGGAGSANVHLVKSYLEAKKFIKKMFGTGIRATSGFADLTTKFRKHKKKNDLWRTFFHTFPRIILSMARRQTISRERGYVYFQEFLPENNSDIRIVVVGDRATGILRYCRPNDFRASGSGEKSYDCKEIPLECVKLAFDVSRKLKMQSCAFDFLRTLNGHYVVIEVSYGFVTTKYPGYWDKNLLWHGGDVNVCMWMVENLVESMRNGHKWNINND